jgi:ribosomal protein L11 methylase PrmA
VNAGARAFVFVSKTAKAHEIAEAIVANINKLATIIINTTPPFIAHMLLSGHVYVVFPADKRG